MVVVGQVSWHVILAEKARTQKKLLDYCQCRLIRLRTDSMIDTLPIDKINDLSIHRYFCSAWLRWQIRSDHHYSGLIRGLNTRTNQLKIRIQIKTHKYKLLFNIVKQDNFILQTMTLRSI